MRGSHRTARIYGPGSPRTRTGSPCCHCGSKEGGWEWLRGGGRKSSELVNQNGEKRDEEILQDAGTHGTLDGPEGEQVLGSVAAVSAPGLVARVVSLLQDELLSLELGVLITHPARKQKQGRYPQNSIEGIVDTG